MTDSNSHRREVVDAEVAITEKLLGRSHIHKLGELDLTEEQLK